MVVVATPPPLVAVEKALDRTKPLAVRVVSSPDGRKWACRYYDNRPSRQSLDYTKYVIACVEIKTNKPKSSA